MRRDLIFPVFLSLLVLSSALHSQTTGNQPLQIKEGLWELTTTTQTTATLPDEMLKQLSPEQRQQVLDSLKAGQASTQTSATTPLCVTREHLLSGDILDDSFGCSGDITSNAQKLNRHMRCPDSSERTINVERISAAAFKGDRTVAMNNSNHAKMSSTFSAAWKSAYCAPQVDPHQEETLVKEGFDRDVLRLLPYGGSRLGEYFQYSWAAGRYPDIAYLGGAPDFPKRAFTPALRFNGTDGTYLYVTITSIAGSICAQPDNLLKIDKTGKYTFVDHMPKGIHGGWGPPPC